MGGVWRIALFAFLIFTSFAFAGVWGDAAESYGKKVYCNEPIGQGGQAPGFEQWKYLTALALAISVFLVALVFIGGYGLQSPSAIAWAKENLFQVFASAIVVVFFLLSTWAVDSAAAVFSQNNVPSIDLAIAYAHAIGGTVSADLAVVTFFNVMVSVVGTMHILLNPGGFGGIVFQTQYMFRPIMDLLNMIIVLLSGVFGEWFVHLFLLCFIKKYMLSILLPAGIFLRTFPLTRGMGGALIAIAIGFYIVYPAMINISGMAIAERYGFVDEQGNPCMDASGNPSVFKMVGSSATCFFRTHFSGEFFENLGSMLGGFGVMSFLTWILSGNFILGGIPYLIVAVTISMLMDVAYFLVVVGMILPLINLFVTFTMIREISRHLGTDVNIGSLMRVL